MEISIERAAILTSLLDTTSTPETDDHSGDRLEAHPYGNRLGATLGTGVFAQKGNVIDPQEGARGSGREREDDRARSRLPEGRFANAGRKEGHWQERDK